MSRPRKCRRVCHYPNTLAFKPVENNRPEGIENSWSAGSENIRLTEDEDYRSTVVLTVDEYETIRLIDKEGFSQEQCSEYMRIARTTVQMIYMSARKKLSEMLVEGRPLRIEGGEYEICNGEDTFCGCGSCFKRVLNEKYKKVKGDHIMRIAVTYENGQIFQHFGHTEEFKVYDVEDGKILASEVVSTNGSGHGALAGVLNALNADVLICGGIGAGAQQALAAAGIELYGGVSGDADQAVEAFVTGKLAYDPDVQCNHHGEHHHGGNCGEHSCGEHFCVNEVE